MSPFQPMSTYLPMSTYWPARLPTSTYPDLFVPLYLYVVAAEPGNGISHYIQNLYENALV